MQIDPLAQYEYYVNHIVNQHYLGCETPLARLFSTPGFTETSSAALDLQDTLVKSVQRDIKRAVEASIFDWVVADAGFDKVYTQLRRMAQKERLSRLLF